MAVTSPITAHIKIDMNAGIPTKISLRGWLVCITAALFFFYEFVQMNMMNAINDELKEAFSLNAVHLGYLSSTYFVANVIFLFPAGMILDKISTRKVLLTMMTFSILGTAVFAVSTNPWLAGFGRFLTGIGSAFCFLSSIKLASRWFPPKHMAFVVGVIVTIAMLGGIVAQLPFTVLTDTIGWRPTLLIDAVAGVVIFILIWMIVEDHPEHIKQPQTSDLLHVNYLSSWQSLGHAVSKIQNWLCGIYTCMMNLPIVLLGGLWGIRYLVTTHSLSDEKASIITSMLFLGSLIGSPTVGFVSDFIHRRKLPMIIGGLLSLAIVLIIILRPSLSFTELMLLFFLLGFVTITQIVSYPTVAEINPIALTATSVSIVSMSVIGGGAIFPPFFGWLMHWHWQGNALHGTPIYTVSDFHFAMWLFPIGFIVATIATLFIKETYCQR